MNEDWEGIWQWRMLHEDLQQSPVDQASLFRGWDIEQQATQHQKMSILRELA